MAKKSFIEIYNEDPKLAAGFLQNAFIHVVNNIIPEIYVTKEQYKELVKIILAGEAIDPDGEVVEGTCAKDLLTDDEETGNEDDGSGNPPQVTGPAASTPGTPVPEPGDEDYVDQH